jgi:hypothetical protein
MFKISDKVKAALADVVRTAVATALAVWLGLGISIFDANADALKAVVATAVAAALHVVLKYIDPTSTDYGRGSK